MHWHFEGAMVCVQEAERDNLPDSRKMIDLEEQILAIDAQLPTQQQAAGGQLLCEPCILYRYIACEQP